MRLSLYHGLFLQITHPAQERLDTPPGSTSPTLFEKCGVCSFMSLKNQISESVVSCRPYPKVYGSVI